MPTVEFADERLWVRSADGPSPPLVFVHGAGASSLSWILQYRQYRGRHRLVQVDLPGHGRSAGAGRAALPEYAAVVLGLLDALGLDRVVLFGHSMGGGIALALALAAPERLAGLVLTSTSAKLGAAPPVLRQIREAPETLPELMGPFICAPGAPAEIVERSVAMLVEAGPELLAGDLEACEIPDHRPRLAEIQVPALVVTGRQDLLTPPADAEHLAAHLPDAELRLIEGAGHMVMIETPAEYHAAVDVFLARPGVAG